MGNFFFFQAEDGIRYLVRSRGLGDVYKRQAGTRKRGASPEEDAALAAELLADEKERAEHTQLPVSYTHLTLPTSDLV